MSADLCCIRLHLGIIVIAVSAACCVAVFVSVKAIVYDAIAVIVSEETGFISYASRGKVRTNISLQELDRLLNKDVA